MTNHPDTTQEWETAFDELFTYKDEKMDHPRPEVCNGLKWREVKHFIAEQIKAAEERGFHSGFKYCDENKPCLQEQSSTPQVLGVWQILPTR